MALHKIINHNQSIVGVWKIEESEKELLSLIDSRVFDEGRLSLIKHQNKKNEWLASRVLLSEMLKKYKIEYRLLIKNEFGTPVLIDCNYFVSLTHSHDYCAVILSKDSFTGVDIESNFEKAHLLRNKFMNDAELKIVGANKQFSALIWSAKESMYKAYGKKKLIFKRDMNVSRIDIESNLVSACLVILQKDVTIKIKTSNEFVLTYF